MATLPQLVQEDIQTLTEVLHELLYKSDSSCAMVLDKGGFIVLQVGDTSRFDTVTLGALCAATYAATEGIAKLVAERNFSSVYQQGDVYSLLVHDINEYCLLVVVFRAQVSVGAVKYFAAETILKIAEQMNVAQERNPQSGFDLSEINLADPSPLFLRKSA